MTSGLEILLIEDNDHDLELTMRALRKNRLANSVQVLRDGQEALDYLFGEGAFAGRDPNDTPKVIFLDLKLPKVDGVEVLRRIKADERTRRIPVVVVTSSSEERDRFATYDLGANSYVVKPIEFDSFMKTISDLGFYWLAVNEPPPRRGA
ncbi:MAG TPA: response regulator [Thermoanaerobaculia bacterium]|nr:response regulator [Thermoanaerobaculia bacterium]